MPFLDFTDCSKGNLNCVTIGALPEIFDILGSLFNFTVNIYREPDDNWGSVPSAGSYAAGDATFTGAMGAVIYDECELGLAMWIPMIERVRRMNQLNKHRLCSHTEPLISTDQLILF